MENTKIQIKQTLLGDRFHVSEISTNVETETETITTLFTGSISECKDYIALKEKGYII